VSASRIDLHVHSTISDGTLAPAEVVAEAAGLGIRLLSITDHDTTDGLGEAMEASRGTAVTFVPGVELSVGSQTQEVHVLGYFINPADASSQGALAWLRRARDERNAAIVDRLRALGMGVELERVRQIAGAGSVGRPHIAAAMVEAGHVPSVQQAFHRYLARGKSAYVPRERLSPEEACEMIRAAGGLPVLAHPAKIASRALLGELLTAGLAGLEVYHCDQDERDNQELLGLARERSLLVTGGTDSHGPRGERPMPIGGVAVPDWVEEELLVRAPAWWAAQR